MLNRQPVNSLKGIGEKTGKLFEKLGVVTIDDLLSYYPRAYDAYEPGVYRAVKGAGCYGCGVGACEGS